MIGNLLLSWGGAWLLLTHSASPVWLPLAVIIGVLTHIAGDGLTKEGVSVPLFWQHTRLQMPMLARLTRAVVSAARGALRRS